MEGLSFAGFQSINTVFIIDKYTTEPTLTSTIRLQREISFFLKVKLKSRPRLKAQPKPKSQASKSPRSRLYLQPQPQLCLRLLPTVLSSTQRLHIPRLCLSIHEPKDWRNPWLLSPWGWS